MMGVVFLLDAAAAAVDFEALLMVAAAEFGTALPDRICLFGDPSVALADDGTIGPTDCERPPEKTLIFIFYLNIKGLKCVYL